MSDPGVTTWTTTRVQLIDALRDRKVLASTPVLEGDEALAALADAILACLPERDAEFERLRSGAHTLGHIVTHMSRTMRAAQIEMRQNGAEKAMEWILNAIPDVDDNDPADQWDGSESAEAWLDRTAEVAGE